MRLLDRTHCTGKFESQHGLKLRVWLYLKSTEQMRSMTATKRSNPPSPNTQHFHLSAVLRQPSHPKHDLVHVRVPRIQSHRTLCRIFIVVAPDPDIAHRQQRTLLLSVLEGLIRHLELLRIRLLGISLSRPSTQVDAAALTKAISDVGGGDVRHAAGCATIFSGSTPPFSVCQATSRSLTMLRMSPISSCPPAWRRIEPG
jgi:hypothetical protein